MLRGLSSPGGLVSSEISVLVVQEGHKSCLLPNASTLSL